MTTTPNNCARVELVSGVNTPIGSANVYGGDGFVAIYPSGDGMGFHLSVSPACARALAAALLEQADVAEREGVAA